MGYYRFIGKVHLNESFLYCIVLIAIWDSCPVFDAMGVGTNNEVTHCVGGSILRGQFGWFGW